jgi:hypothetical protein
VQTDIEPERERKVKRDTDTDTDTQRERERERERERQREREKKTSAYILTLPIASVLLDAVERINDSWLSLQSTLRMRKERNKERSKRGTERTVN